MAREMVRRRVVSVSAIAILGLALVGALLAVMNSQVAFAKTNPPGAMRQTGDTTGMTGTTGAMMSYSDMEATGQAMMHLLLALHAVHEMQKDQMHNPSMMMGDTGSTMTTTDTTGTTAGMGAMMSGADVGGLLEVLGHTAESMGYMHEAMAGMSGMMGVMGDTTMSDTMTGGMADLTPMLDILDQMVQATTDQVNGMAGMTGGADMGSTDATTDTTGAGATGATTDTTGTADMGSDMTGMMASGSINSSALLPDMAQTLQAMATQLRSMMDTMNGMTGGADMGSSDTSTDTTGTGTTGSDTISMGSDMMGMGTPSTRQSFQAMGMALELMGDMHKMIAMNHMMGAGMTGTTDSTTGSMGDTSSMTGLIGDLAGAMSDQLNAFTGGMGGDMMGSTDTGSTDTGATGTTTDTTGTGATDTTTDTTGTGGTTGSTGSDMMGMGSSNDVLSSAAQLAQTLLDQIQSAAGGMGGTNSQ